MNLLLVEAIGCGLFDAASAAPSAKRSLAACRRQGGPGPGLQQLQQFGLPQVLPATLSAATQRLRQVTQGMSQDATAAQDSMRGSGAAALGITSLSESALLSHEVVRACVVLLSQKTVAQQAVQTTYEGFFCTRLDVPLGSVMGMGGEVSLSV